MNGGHDGPWLGVIGGMGPAATADFLAKLTEETDAQRDQDHVPTLVYGDPRVPDRTAALVEGGPSPLPWLAAGLRFLERSGVAAVAMPCNTAHVWYRELVDGAALPLLHIVDEVIGALRSRVANNARVGVLSTEGVEASGLYRRHLAAAGLLPLEAQAGVAREELNAGIAAVKAGRVEAARDPLGKAAARLVDDGAEALVVACTDISVVIDEATDVDVPIVDANRALASGAIRALRGSAPAAAG